MIEIFVACNNSKQKFVSFYSAYLIILVRLIKWNNAYLELREALRWKELFFFVGHVRSVSFTERRFFKVRTKMRNLSRSILTTKQKLVERKTNARSKGSFCNLRVHTEFLICIVTQSRCVWSICNIQENTQVFSGSKFSYRSWSHTRISARNPSRKERNFKLTSN